MLINLYWNIIFSSITQLNVCLNYFCVWIQHPAEVSFRCENVGHFMPNIVATSTVYIFIDCYPWLSIPEDWLSSQPKLALGISEMSGVIFRWKGDSAWVAVNEECRQYGGHCCVTHLLGLLCFEWETQLTLGYSKYVWFSLHLSRDYN